MSKVALCSVPAGCVLGSPVSRSAAPDLLGVTGRALVNGVEAGPRDGIAISGESKLRIEAEDDAELVLVDAR